MTVTRRLWVTLSVVGGAGLLATIVLTVIEGAKYRLREDQGLDPLPAPTWVAISSYVGLSVFALAAVALVIASLIARVRRRSASEQDIADDHS